MAPIRGNKRRHAPDPEEASSHSSESASPEPATQRRRISNQDEDAANESDASNNHERSDSQGQMVKKLVRLALACEYNRRPIRRADISEKVLGSAGGAKNFRKVFQGAQHELRLVFGMEMMELPAKEKITLQQKRAAAKSQSQATKTTTSWVLTSILPRRFRIEPDVLLAPSAPTNAEDTKYTTIYTMLVSFILLAGGQLQDAKMERYLRRLGLEDNTPVPGYEKTEKLLKRMEKDGYVLKIKDNVGNGEEDVYWVVGPRGKVEVGEKGVEGLVKGVYNLDTDDPEGQDLDRRVARSLGIGEKIAPAVVANGDGRKKGRARRRGAEEEGEDEDGDDSEG